MDDLNKFQKRMLVYTKINADIITWLGMGIVSSCLESLAIGLLSRFRPGFNACPQSAAYGALGADMRDMYLEICTITPKLQAYALTWLVFSFMRIFFLASRGHAGLVLKLFGLKIARQDGGPVTLGFAARYALLEWLPVHIFSAYVLIFGLPANLAGLGGLTFLICAAQLVWLAPFLFLFKARNMAEIATRGMIVFTDKKAVKVATIYPRKLKRWYNETCIFLSRAMYAVLAVFLVLTSVQFLRTSSVDPGYERLLYADRAPVWDNNLYFSIEGLTAPAAFTDTYAYGRAKVAQRLDNLELLKRMAGIAYPYTAFTGAPPLQKDKELAFDDKDWRDLSCLYSLSSVASEKCADQKDVQAYIDANRTIWDRFNSLPAYTLYRSSPQALDVYSSGSAMLVSLGRLKAAQIIGLAETSEAEKAFQEWYKYMRVYRLMAGTRETVVFKAIILTVVGQHILTLQKLLYLQPGLVKNHAAEINAVLDVSAENLYKPEDMLVDDMGMMEPVFLSLIGNVNAIRNDLYGCLQNARVLARLPVRAYPFKNTLGLCDMQGMSFGESVFYAIKRPGNFIANTVEVLTYGHILDGAALIGNMKVHDMRLRMARAGVEILQRGVPAEQVPATLSSLPGDLQNSLTQQPFAWDDKTQSLFFISPVSDIRFDFRLRL